ncbi:hypothetical protein [Archangium sp.]|uniref:hypothetical protein n=1 Tax=Archangium sp. TaxID=1872627 RepID=UPI002D2997E1|nr:hypothetical protein [Archangium sp.]HYO52205.1 hypothetical protein [Archangium sp.]
MQNRVIPTEVEVLGQSIMAMIGGMEILKTRALKILADNGIPQLEPQGWYPMRNALTAIRSIEEKIGPVTMRAVGRKIPEHSKFPPDIRTLEDALRSLDKAYQMNHRKQQGGNIGGYHFEAAAEGRGGRMVCDNPYPCNFDHGIIEALCERFRPKDAMWVRVEHGPQGCRHKGSGDCTYLISW